ncbi:hypothetical protein SAMN05720382_102621 [Polaromonas sp. JS666]|nr:hypothetical protein SAMN05720382_102621 [Polaromonas sp. JS666]
MSRLWKVLIVLSLALSAVCALYICALLYPNPYSTQYYETQQLKLELHQLRVEMAELKATQTLQKNK